MSDLTAAIHAAVQAFVHEAPYMPQITGVTVKVTNPLDDRIKIKVTYEYGR